MDINGTHMGASIYSMKKAMEMPKNMLNLVQQIPDTRSQPLNTESPVAKQSPDLATITGKGNIIDIIA